ncbi:MAG: hypothetical protein ACE5K7_07800 [Phycisphaerae bacterium]
MRRASLEAAMMLHAALTFWLLVIVFCAWGVHRIWGGLLRPRTVNMLLLPGTLVAQLGYVLGVLVTGGTVNNTTIIKDDETAEPQQADNPRPRIPIIGPVAIAMLPLVACGVGLYAVWAYLGGEVMSGMAARSVPAVLPLSLGGFWALLHELITIAEQLVDGVRSSDLWQLRTAVFIYLVICLTVRMAPFPGNLRGSLGAVVLVGVIAALASSLTGATDAAIQRGWAVLSFAVGALLVLLMISLLIRGLVELVRVLARQG